ncbi:unnamed protein product [Phytophthora lilii]|uniref:Unnamed protein product n=1 Tax=Phytophthora lilii TaxID=2077276 RepID=A0A9W6X5W0_9STRA|nr:unnamed protein product [Phytophthora lilii]
MRYFNIKNDKEYSTKRKDAITRAIEWENTLNFVIGEIGGGVRAMNIKAGEMTNAKEQAEAYKEINHIIQVISLVDPEEANVMLFNNKSFETPALKEKSEPTLTAAKEAKDFVYEPPAGKGLVGRGLKGAGIVAPRKKNRSYNLADIEGSGTASDLKYKRIGTKFIRKADLLNNRLKLVFPNRTSVGPIRDMSDELTAMVKDLLYNDNISQQAYRAYQSRTKESAMR